MQNRKRIKLFAKRIVRLIFGTRASRNSPFIHAVSTNLGKGATTVLDIGGGGGDNYLLIRPYLPRRQQITWVINDNLTLWVETASAREKFRKSGDVIARIDRLADHQEATDFLLLNGTLQYLPSINWVLEQLSSRPKYVVVNRTVLTSEPTKIVQQEVLLGIGESRAQFLISNIVYREQDLLDAFSTAGYGVETRSMPVPYGLRTNQGSIRGYYRTLTFRDRDCQME